MAQPSIQPQQWLVSEQFNNIIGKKNRRMTPMGWKRKNRKSGFIGSAIKIARSACIGKFLSPFVLTVALLAIVFIFFHKVDISLTTNQERITQSYFDVIDEEKMRCLAQWRHRERDGYK